MNKHVVNTLKNYNFTYNKNIGYGFIDGYEVNVFYNAVAYGPVFYFSTFLSQSQKNEFVYRINSSKLMLVQAQAFDFGVAVMIGSMTAKTYEKKYETVMSIILKALNDLKAPKKDVCPQSGEEIDEADCKCIDIPSNCMFLNVPSFKIKVRLSNKAVATLNSYISSSNEDFKNAPTHYLKGFCGVLFGALVGVALTVFFTLFGYISFLFVFVSILLGIFLYKKFGGKQNYIMFIMSFVKTLIAITLGLIIMYVVVADKAVVDAGIIGYRGFNTLLFCLRNVPKIKRPFYGGIVLNIFVIFLAEGLSLYRLIMMIKRPKGLE